MAKEAKAKKTDPKQQLEQLFNQLVKQHTEFTQPLVELPEHELAKAGLIQGLVEGNLTPTVMLVALNSDNWEYASDFAKLELLVIELLGDIDVELWPIFAALTDGQKTQYVRLFSSQGTIAVDKLPTLNELKEYKTLERDQTFRWSMKTYTDLMKKLNFWHESVFRFTRDNVDDKNAIIEEVAKLLFLESFRVHHDESMTFKSKSGNEYVLSEVFTWQYVEQHGAQAVELIRDAFETLKSHEDYIVVTDDGTKNPIFSERVHINLNRPENFISLLKAIQDLGPVTDNRGNIVHAQGNLGHVSGDLLGRVFDVFLRANFDSKGGNGVYLTPNPVKQAMVEIALHDIASDSTELARLSNGDFRFCDPTCGSFGFGSVVLSQLQKLIDNEIGMPDVDKEKLKEKLKNHGFTGADSTPRMVMLARVNMALQGAPKAQIFQTQDSLVTQALQPNSFDLICTNPPFGSPSFGKNEQESKKDYERHMEQVLGGFRPAEKVVDNYNAYYDHLKMKWDDTGDLYLNEDGTPKWAGYRTDLRKTGGSDKNPVYSLQPSTAGLALGSKPDGKGNWKQVGATIDPAVLFIDRCLQLLKPGGRLMIVLPDGILCNSGDRYVREYIMGKKDEQTGEFVGGKAIVKAVISLPSDCFKLSGTGAKTSILYLQKRHANPNQPEQFLPEPQTEVFMAVAETLGYVVKNNIEDYNAGVANDLDKIVSAYKRGE
ncbi:type I restriction enzyme M protein [Vibrio diazotrophicus]|jgi:type I restriction enzyme M protein|uniref:Type I restriction enzyme M protein n=1 Tax=Vibrio diazotrophicus TaxID=685 RepID=A0A329EBJ2_VIBDI|nr:N-6 DNA methylase [Vibrio diazotrophicus]EIV0335995.1 N-6 DNA methylase [Vibrio cholerae]MBY8104892.1 SAM-dependent methyltransferase [Vibrio fluvialis]RAS64333.1 type I restriction enzyme M protein [Vibrio diazotrophicus]